MTLDVARMQNTKEVIAASENQNEEESAGMGGWKSNVCFRNVSQSVQCESIPFQYGPLLRENYVAAVKREDKLHNMANVQENISGPEKLYVKQRVPMDFTGTGGRVVADPNEAIGVAYEEARHWRVSVVQYVNCAVIFAVSVVECVNHAVSV